MSKSDYKKELHALRIELVKLQNEVIAKDLRIVVVFEGRDAAGKDGVIKRIIKHLSPRETRVVALGKPSDADQASWYFQRFVGHLPVKGELVLFNRSWYNRAGVEHVMGFCSPEEYETFLTDAPQFEELLVRSGLILRKYYLDIGKAEQKQRLADRRDDPLSQWKNSPIDEVAVQNWENYSTARDRMLLRTHSTFGPWDLVRTDDKHTARLQTIKALLASIDYKGKDASLLEVVFRYHLDRPSPLS
jgi:polyphosphate kinase